MSQKKSKAVLNTQNPSARLSNVYFLALILLHLLPHHLALDWKNSLPSNHLLLIPSVWCLLASGLLQDLDLETLYLLLTIFGHIHNLFHDLLHWFCCNPVKPCTPSGYLFLQEKMFLAWWLILLLLLFVCSFSLAMPKRHLQLYNPSRLSWHPLYVVFFHTTDNPFHRIPCVISLKGPYNPLI